MQKYKIIYLTYEYFDCFLMIPYKIIFSRFVLYGIYEKNTKKCKVFYVYSTFKVIFNNNISFLHDCCLIE